MELDNSDSDFCVCLHKKTFHSICSPLERCYPEDCLKIGQMLESYQQGGHTATSEHLKQFAEIVSLKLKGTML